MKYLTILIMIVSVFPTVYAQYLGEIESYHIDLHAKDHQYPVFYQSSFTKFTQVSYDESANSLIFSITKSTDLIDSIAITMNQNTFSDLLSTEYTTESDKILVLINGEETSYRTIKEGRIISWVFRIPPDSTEIEIISSTPRFETGNYRMEDIPNSLPNTYPPLKQWQLGLRWLDAQCKDDLELVVKVSNGHFACVKNDSVEPLVKRWWASTNRISEMVNPQTYQVANGDKLFQVHYSLSGAKLSEMVHDNDANSIHVKLNDSDGGKLVISLPRELIDAKIGKSSTDDLFFILIDGVEFAYGEKTSQDERTLTIHFPRNSYEIEIIGTSWI